MNKLLNISICLFIVSIVSAQKQIKIPAIEHNYIHIYIPEGDFFLGPDMTELKKGQYYQDWVPNDHSFVRSEKGNWHLFGITHPLTSVRALHEGEVMSLHAIAPAGTFKNTLKPGAWKNKPKVLTPAEREGDLPDFYAPTHVKKDCLNYLIWGLGAPLRYATSKDFNNWEYKGRLMNTPENRDPNVLFYEGTYYLITCGLYCVNIATSKDLVNWTKHKPILTNHDSVDYESPFLVRYNNTFYLFVCTWDNSKWDKKTVSGAYQHITWVYQSNDIFNFGKPITQINAHAPEIIQDEDGNWYISSAEWPFRGISVARLVWK